MSFGGGPGPTQGPAGKLTAPWIWTKGLLFSGELPVIHPLNQNSTFHRGILELRAKDKVRRFLCLSCRLHNQLVIILQSLQPVLQVCGGIVQGEFGNSGLPAQKRRAHFGNEFLPAVFFGAKAVGFGDGRTVQAILVPSRVGEFMVKRRKIFVLAREAFGVGNSDSVLNPRIIGAGHAVLDLGRVRHVSDNSGGGRGRDRLGGRRDVL